jgi:hypothetical protein
LNSSKLSIKTLERIKYYKYKKHTMNEIVRKDILLILSKALNILKKQEEEEIAQLKELSNHTIHNSSIFQDDDSIDIAVLVYSLSQIIERKHFIDTRIVKQIEESYYNLKKNSISEYKRTIKNLFKTISKIDEKLKMYIEEVIDQAQIKKGSKLYAHGISLARSAELLGTSQWELMNYVGKTQISESTDRTDIRARLQLTRGLFKK